MSGALPRKIIHCDCDCFYAAVEVRDDPGLAGRPLAVGGRPERRGVVATCNYEARAFGIHSAMAMAQALRRCPDLVVLPPDFPRYRRVAEQIRTIFRDFTPLVEPLSLDEAFQAGWSVSLCAKRSSLAWATQFCVLSALSAMSRLRYCLRMTF